ncbi:MAG: rane protein of unknown function [Armatimonadetes bacterium]|jgi:uncharacterized membrane protein|nr:rane protein of unknown function [Armatimonadota bacterium]
MLFFAEGLLLAAVAVPLVREQVPRNHWYGFRVPKTLASDQVWYPANRFLGRELVVSGLLIAVGSLLLSVAAARLSVDQTAWLGLALTLIPLTVTIVRGLRYLTSL